MSIHEFPIQRIIALASGDKQQEAIELFEKTFHLFNPTANIYKHQPYGTVSYGTNTYIFLIERLVNSGLKDQAIQLFDHIILLIHGQFTKTELDVDHNGGRYDEYYDDHYAKRWRFSIDAIGKLALMGLKVQAIQLFDETVKYAFKSFRVDRITHILEIPNPGDFKEQAIQLFDKTVQYAKDFSFSQIEYVNKNLSKERAIQLFDLTVNDAKRRLHHKIPLIAQKLTDIGLKAQATKLLRVDR